MKGGGGGQFFHSEAAGGRFLCLLLFRRCSRNKLGLDCVCACVSSVMWLLVTLWIVAYQVPLSMGFAMLSSRGSSRPRDWASRVSFSSCIAGGFFTAEPSRIRLIMVKMHLKTRIKSRLSMLLLEVILVFTHVDTGRSVQLSGFFFLLPSSQLWNPCFKITIVRSPECKTDNPICSQTWGSYTHHCENHSFHPMEKGTATHSSILAWRIPRTEEPGQLQSMGSQRVRTQLSSQHNTTI